LNGAGKDSNLSYGGILLIVDWMNVFEFNLNSWAKKLSTLEDKMMVFAVSEKGP
jgi:hypothetical protein